MRNSEPLDGKQIRLISQWYKLSEGISNPYLEFMTKWIAFNAICYHLYRKQAVNDRVNIEGGKAKLKKIKEALALDPSQNEVMATARSTESRLIIELEFPEKLRLRIEEKYTEDRIFDAFAKDETYTVLLMKNEGLLKPLFEQLQKVLLKTDSNGKWHPYVINMAKYEEYSYIASVAEMASKHIIVRCHEYSLRVIKDVLYQIRCNVFHGEKTPENIADDVIVMAAMPILDQLLVWMMKDLGMHQAKSGEWIC